MKKFLFLILISSFSFAQEFTVQKISGNVFVQKGFKEKIEKIKVNDRLLKNDLIITEENSFIQLSGSDGSNFILRANSALGLNYLKKISMNDLLLALTQEEIRAIPRTKISSANTAVYGKNESNTKNTTLENKLGQRKINGAKQLAENGFKESAVLAAKETFRKYPETAKSFDDRLFFADILKEIGLKEEAGNEYSKLNEIAVNSVQKSILQKKIEETALMK